MTVLSKVARQVIHILSSTIHTKFIKLTGRMISWNSSLVDGGINWKNISPNSWIKTVRKLADVSCRITGKPFPTSYWRTSVINGQTGHTKTVVSPVIRHMVRPVIWLISMLPWIFRNVKVSDCRSSTSKDCVRTHWPKRMIRTCLCWNMPPRQLILQEKRILLPRHLHGWRSISVLPCRNVNRIWIWCLFPESITCFSTALRILRKKPNGPDGCSTLLSIWVRQTVFGVMLLRSSTISPVARAFCKWDGRIMISWFIFRYMICGMSNRDDCYYSRYTTWINWLLSLSTLSIASTTAGMTGIIFPITLFAVHVLKTGSWLLRAERATKHW